MIYLALPSRGRPQALRECLASAWETAITPEEVGAVIRLDYDDAERSSYQRLGKAGPVVVLQKPRRTLGMAFDDAGLEAVVRGAEIVMLCGDDIRFRTPGWDQIVYDTFEQWPDRIGLVYGRDGHQDEKMATHPFVSAEWIRAVGYYIPHALRGSMVDVWLHNLGVALDRIYYEPALYTEHLHPDAGKGRVDRTYRDRDHSRVPWRRVMDEGLFDQALDKLIQAMFAEECG